MPKSLRVKVKVPLPDIEEMQPIHEAIAARKAEFEMYRLHKVLEARILVANHHLEAADAAATNLAAAIRSKVDGINRAYAELQTPQTTALDPVPPPPPEAARRPRLLNADAIVHAALAVFNKRYLDRRIALIAGHEEKAAPKERKEAKRGAATQSRRRM